MYRALSYACFIGYYTKEKIGFLSGPEALFRATFCIFFITCVEKATVRLSRGFLIEMPRSFTVLFGTRAYIY